MRGTLPLGIADGGQTIELAHYVITSRLGTAPGASSQIRYNMDVTTADGISRLTEIMPGNQRWPDEVDIRGADVNTNGLGLVVGGHFEPFVWEVPHFGPCSGNMEGLVGLLLEKIAKLEARVAAVEAAR